MRQAALEMGIPEPEVIEYATAQLQKPAELSYEMKLVAEASLAMALKILMSIAQEGPRISDRMSTMNNSDLDAAKALAKIAIDTLKISTAQNPEARTPGGPRASLQLDLWDSPGAWELRKPGT